MTISAIGAGALAAMPRAGASGMGEQPAVLPSVQTETSSAPSTISLSDASVIASTLLDSANRYVAKEHLEPFSGYDNGNVPASGYLDITKYNKYVIDKAASNMVDAASKAGVTLKKEDVTRSLTSANPAIANMTQNESVRQSKLGDSSVLIDLGSSDRSYLTDMYIQAREKGLDTSQVEVIAAKMGLAARDQKNGVTTYVYDPEKEITGYGNKAVSTRADNDTAETMKKLVASGVKNLGIGDAALLQVVQSSSAGNTDALKTLDFIRNLLSLK